MFPKSDELKDRVEARRHQLLAKKTELQADGRRVAAVARARIEEGLEELDATLPGGWDRADDAVRAKLSAWLDRT
jgi:hypothetical protein